MPPLPEIPRRAIVAAGITWVLCVVATALLHDATGTIGTLARTALQTVASVALAATGLSAVAELWRRAEWRRRTYSLGRSLLADAEAETLRLAQLAYAIPLGLLDPADRRLALPLSEGFHPYPHAELMRFMALAKATTGAALAAANEEMRQAHTQKLSEVNQFFDALSAEVLDGSRATGPQHGPSTRAVPTPISDAIIEAWQTAAPAIEDRSSAVLRRVTDVVPYIESAWATLAIKEATGIQSHLREAIFKTLTALPEPTPMEVLWRESAVEMRDAVLAAKAGQKEVLAQIAALESLVNRHTSVKASLKSGVRSGIGVLLTSVTEVISKMHSAGIRAAAATIWARWTRKRTLRATTTAPSKASAAARPPAVLERARTSRDILVAVHAVVDAAWGLHHTLTLAGNAQRERAVTNKRRRWLRPRPTSAADRIAEMLDRHSESSMDLARAQLDRIVDDLRDGRSRTQVRTALGERLVELQIAVLDLEASGQRNVDVFGLAAAGATAEEIIAATREGNDRS